MQRTLCILRGVPGSGKSTLARRIAGQSGGEILSTDDFFLDENGVYVFDASLLGKAHQWNQERAILSMSRGVSSIIIDNTHTQKWEAKPYVTAALCFGYTIDIREPDAPWWINRDVEALAANNTHGVSADAVSRMCERWETDFGVQEIKSAQAGPLWQAGYNDAKLEIACTMRKQGIITEEQMLEVIQMKPRHTAPPPRRPYHR
ncbi:NEDD4-binding protein 2 [Gaertneriomyces sp. JEL0708]|nr:NEDD4-binding protein 2 [Gaertneriomyces sp. JEL0708]